jgi:hypothetical protein
MLQTPHHVKYEMNDDIFICKFFEKESETTKRAFFKSDLLTEEETKELQLIPQKHERRSV